MILEGEAPIGECVPVKITGAMTYDLTGAVVMQDAAVVGVGQIAEAHPAA